MSTQLNNDKEKVQRIIRNLECEKLPRISETSTIIEKNFENTKKKENAVCKNILKFKKRDP